MSSAGSQRRYKVWRSLDRSLSFFGLRGRFFLVFSLMSGVSLVICFAVGALLGVGLIGTVLFLALEMGVYLFVISLQTRISEKDLSKWLSHRRVCSQLRFSSSTPRSIVKHINIRHMHEDLNKQC